MGEALLSLIQVNQGVDYSFVIPLIIGYVILFWVIVSVWVYYDAKKRYEGMKMPRLIALGNFVFQVPFLLLYLLFRPIEEDYANEGSQGGVNVPIVNFIGKEGVAMSLELKINHNALMPDNASEMKIDVSFDSQDQNKSLVQPVIPGTLIPAGSVNIPVKGFWTKLKAKFPKKAEKKVEVVEEKPNKKNKKKKKK